MTTGRGDGSYGRHRLGTCPGFFPIGIYRTVTTDAAGWESASASSRGSTTCSRLWMQAVRNLSPSSVPVWNRLGPNAPMSTTQGRCLGLGIYSPGVPATRRAAANGGRAMSRFGIYPPAVPTTRRAGSTTEEQCPALGIYPQECLRPDSPRSTTQGRCLGLGIYSPGVPATRRAAANGGRAMSRSRG
jgi:hypothetical protein